jgi:hypothetical protein
VRLEHLCGLGALWDGIRLDEGSERGRSGGARAKESP